MAFQDFDFPIHRSRENLNNGEASTDKVETSFGIGPLPTNIDPVIVQNLPKYVLELSESLELCRNARDLVADIDNRLRFITKEITNAACFH